jgi:two-component system, NtrC family, C4-dicarboxylate transport sensor histidine kinase DctB
MPSLAQPLTSAPTHRTRKRSAATVAMGVLMLGLVAAGMGLGYAWSERNGLAQLSAATNKRLDLYASALEAELARYAYLPSLIAIDADIAALLATPDSAQARQRANRTLARMNVRAGSIQMYIVSTGDELLATSNSHLSPNETDGTVARAERSRVAKSDKDTFFAANLIDGTTDYYFAHGVSRNGVRVAQIVVKVSLVPLEVTWIDLGLRTQSERLLVVDENDVVVMSSVPSWKYRTLGATDNAQLRTSGRYAQATLLPLGFAPQNRIEEGAAIVRVIEPAEPGTPLRLAQERAIVPLAARLVVLSDLSDVRRNARYAAWGGGAAGAALGLLMLYLLYRRRAMRQLFQARNALQEAHDQLERQVDERTGQLQAANDELKRQIAQRLQTEDELVQAGKMAVLGQMSAGISHEINQPLTALRALSRNTIKLFDGGRTQAVSDNLRSIDEMAERMGRIVTQLKSFARKGVASSEAVDLAVAVHEVLLLLEHRLRIERVAVVSEIPPGTQVRADITRLEQVLVNLVTNAIDAMAHTTTRVLRISAVRRDNRVVVAVIDSGQGVNDASMARLFEPFFTTKPAGQGLGLGLVISSKIVREFGGTLRASRVDEGMQFEFDLEAGEFIHV